MLKQFNEHIKQQISQIATNEARALLKNGQGKEALQKLDQSLIHNPHNGSSLYLRAGIYFEKNFLKEAFVDINQLILMHPSNPFFYLFRSSIYCKEGNFDKAFEDINYAEQLTSQSEIISQARNYTLQQQNLKKSILNDLYATIGHDLENNQQEDLQETQERYSTFRDVFFTQNPPHPPADNTQPLVIDLTR